MYRKSLLFSCIVLLTASCHRSSDEAVVSQSPLTREIQSCRFPKQEVEPMMREMVEMLEAQGYVILSANPKIGVLTAEKDIYNDEEFSFFVNKVIGKHPRPRKKRSSIRLASNFHPADNCMRVRVVIQKKGYDGYGRVIESRTLRDADIYEQFFMKYRQALYKKDLYL